MQMPITLGNLSSSLATTPYPTLGKKNKTYRIRINLPPVHAIVNLPPLSPRDINHPVNNHVRDVHALRTKLPC